VGTKDERGPGKRTSATSTQTECIGVSKEKKKTTGQEKSPELAEGTGHLLIAAATEASGSELSHKRISGRKHAKALWVLTGKERKKKDTEG